MHHLSKCFEFALPGFFTHGPPVHPGMAELASLVQRLEVAVGRLESMSASGGSAGASAGGGEYHVKPHNKCTNTMWGSVQRIRLNLHEDAKAEPKRRILVLLLFLQLHVHKSAFKSDIYSAVWEDICLLIEL